MKKFRLLLFALVCIFAMGVVQAKTVTEEMLDARKGTLTNINDANEVLLLKNQKLKRKTNTVELSYPFQLGCEHGKTCTYDVTYDGIVNEVGSVTLEQAKAAWNADESNLNRWDKNGMNSGSASLATGSKNRYYAIYKKVGKYNNKYVDVKATVVDFEEMDSDNRLKRSESAITLTNDKIGVAVTGIKWIKIKYEFLDSDTGEAVVVKGNTTYWDIDYNQGIVINNDNTNKGIYYRSTGLKCTTEYDENNKCETEETANELYYAKISAGDYIFDQNSGLDPSAANNLYQDELASTAYAFTEEFEGSSITRTFQFSDPLLTTVVEGENPWNGHGALFLSSTNINENIEHKITTEVVNGEIDPDYVAFTGEDVEINYSPKEGYELSYIEIDGVKISSSELKDAKDKYVFKNVTTDHHIKVVYINNAKTGLFEVGGALLIIAASYVGYMIIIKRKAINEI